MNKEEVLRGVEVGLGRKLKPLIKNLEARAEREIQLDEKYMTLTQLQIAYPFLAKEFESLKETMKNIHLDSIIPPNIYRWGGLPYDISKLIEADLALKDKSDIREAAASDNWETIDIQNLTNYYYKMFYGETN